MIRKVYVDEHATVKEHKPLPHFVDDLPTPRFDTVHNSNINEITKKMNEFGRDVPDALKDHDGQVGGRAGGFIADDEENEESTSMFLLVILVVAAIIVLLCSYNQEEKKHHRSYGRRD